MTVEADLEAEIGTIVDCWPSPADDGTQAPYATYQQVGGVPIVYVDQTVPNAKTGRFQINVWAATLIEAKAILLQIEAALIVSTRFVAAVESGPEDLHDPDAQLRGAAQDFHITSTR